MLAMMSGWETTEATPTQGVTAAWIPQRIRFGNSGECYGSENNYKCPSNLETV